MGMVAGNHFAGCRVTCDDVEQDRPFVRPRGYRRSRLYDSLGSNASLSRHNARYHQGGRTCGTDRAFFGNLQCGDTHLRSNFFLFHHTHP